VSHSILVQAGFRGELTSTACSIRNIIMTTYLSPDWANSLYLSDHGFKVNSASSLHTKHFVKNMNYSLPNFKQFNLGAFPYFDDEKKGTIKCSAFQFDHFEFILFTINMNSLIL
jgi:hypothetical protein